MFSPASCLFELEESMNELMKVSWEETVNKKRQETLEKILNEEKMNKNENIKCFNDSYLGDNPPDFIPKHKGVVKTFKCIKDGEEWGEWELCETCVEFHTKKGWTLIEV
jgi:hypothetical protein